MVGAKACLFTLEPLPLSRTSGDGVHACMHLLVFHGTIGIGGIGLLG